MYRMVVLYSSQTGNMLPHCMLYIHNVACNMFPKVASQRIHYGS